MNLAKRRARARGQAESAGASVGDRERRYGCASRGGLTPPDEDGGAGGKPELKNGQERQQGGQNLFSGPEFQPGLGR